MKMQVKNGFFRTFKNTCKKLLFFFVKNLYKFEISSFGRSFKNHGKNIFKNHKKQTKLNIESCVRVL